jgi:rubrerythrin
MTYEEAIEIISRNICYNILGCMDGICKHTDEKPCAVQMALEALEKQIPKKPRFEGDGYWRGELVYDTWICPNCDTYYEVGTDTHKYCPNCGQAIDWSEEE